jgi:thermostable 8-oxoguanine DNA glycosylase
MIKLKNINKYLQLYDKEKYIFDIIGKRARDRGCLDFNDLYKICMWKSRNRQKKEILKNRKLQVERITRFAFKQINEKSKIDWLLHLKGVGIPTASAILTAVYPNKYAIIDIRCIEMLRSIGLKSVGKTVTFNNWYTYLKVIRKIAKSNNITPREVDMILFAMHEEKLEKYNYKNLYAKQ